MRTIIPTYSFNCLNDKQKAIVIDIISYLFVLLFVYTATGKLMTIETFKDVLSKYPLIKGYQSFVSYFVPFTELFIAFLLIIPSLRKLGLLAALILILIFLLYIIYMFLFKQELPCSCGGIISKLSWQQHIWFNSVFLFLSMFGLIIYKK